MRIALADAGDAMDDANFEHQTANGAILRITKEVHAECSLTCGILGDVCEGVLGQRFCTFSHVSNQALQLVLISPLRPTAAAGLPANIHPHAAMEKSRCATLTPLQSIMGHPLYLCKPVSSFVQRQKFSSALGQGGQAMFASGGTP